MRLKKGKVIIAAALAGVVMVGVTYAAAVNTLSFVEKFETGRVGMTLQQLTVTEKGEVEAASDIVEANKDVSYIPRFTSTDSGCFIRAKVEVIMEGDCNEPLGVEHIYGLSEDWVNQGEYFYCTKSLEQGQQSDLFKGIHIPENWDAGDSEGFSVRITAEAIQSQNFAPDFNEELPWGAVMIEDAVMGTAHYRSAVPMTKTAELTYEAEGGFQCTTEQLFDEFKGMMPGDKCSKAVKIKNGSNNGLRMYLDVSSGKTPLPEKMTLRITCGEEVLYDGVMSEVCKNESFNLIDIKKEGSEKLNFEICLPVDAGNEYAEAIDNLVWEIKAEEIPASAVQTDDSSNMAPYAAAAALAVAVIMSLLLFRRKGQQ